MDDMTDVIELFAANYTATRVSSTIGSDGRVSAGSPSTFTVRGCFQPQSGRQLKRASPEGSREREDALFWTETELLGKLASADPDTLSIEGETYQVQTCLRWATLGNYYKATLAKVGTRP